MESSRTKKIIVIVCVIVFALIVCIGFLIKPFPDGSTLESREKRISILNNGEGWKIDNELVIDDYIISSAYSPENKAALVTFKPEENGAYSIQSTIRRDMDEIITDTVTVNGSDYILISFMGAEVEYAEVTCTDNDSGDQFTQKYEAAAGEIIYFERPWTDFNMNIVYYDKDGNPYE